MNSYAPYVNNLLASLTVLAQLAIVIIAVALLSGKADWLKRFRSHYFPLTFIVALIATLGSLTYSQVLGYLPCQLCWYQRILMYPQVIILGLAWYRKEAAAKLYAFVLSLIGAGFALYQYLLQLSVVPASSCPVVKTLAGFSTSCSDKTVLIFGYITIPLMALTAFIFILMLLAADKKSNQ